MVIEGNKMESNSLDQSYFHFLSRWKKPILISAVTSFILGIVFTGPHFITPKFTSSVIFFPTTTNSVSKALLSGITSKEDILEFGSEEQAEQLLQILNSDEIRSKIVQKYQLMKHYAIDSTAEYPYTRLYEKLNDNITFSRTEYMSVKIEVMDANAQMAADMANDIAALLDTIKTKIQRVRAVEGLKIVEAEYKSKAAQIALMEDSLKGLRNKGIFDYKKQSVILNEEFTKANAEYYNEAAQLSVLKEDKSVPATTVVTTAARVKGAEARMKNMQTKLDNLANYGGANVSLTEVLTLEREQLSLLREKYEKARVDASENLSHKFIVNNAVKAEKKSYPVRWVMVSLIVVSTMLLLILALILFEKMTESNILKFEKNDELF